MTDFQHYNDGFRIIPIRLKRPHENILLIRYDFQYDTRYMVPGIPSKINYFNLFKIVKFFCIQVFADVIDFEARYIKSDAFYCANKRE